MARGDFYAVILAGGGGERLWPLSTPERPKQFVDIFGGKPLIRHAADRLAGLVPPERILVITAARFVDQTRAALPDVPRENIVGEPCWNLRNLHRNIPRPKPLPVQEQTQGLCL